MTTANAGPPGDAHAGGDDTATIELLVDRPHEAIVAHGSFVSFFAAYLLHAQRWGTLPDRRAWEIMRPGLAAAALHLSCQAPDVFAAWTLNLHDPPLNCFIAADNNEFALTGRVFADHVRTATGNRLFLEVQRPRQEPSRSVVEVSDGGTLELFAKFYERSEQLHSRIFELPDDEYVFVRGLPLVDHAWLAGLTAEQAHALPATLHERIENRVYRLHCSCNPDTIRAVLYGMFKDRLDELFQGAAEVDTACPRCGRHWSVARADLERMGEN